MKKIIFALIFLPLTVLAKEPYSENVIKFQKLCKNHHDLKMREHYCALAKDQIKAEKIVNDFSKRS